MDNNNLFGNENQNGQSVQLQKQAEQQQSYQQPYQQEPFQQQPYQQQTYQQPYQNFQQQTYQQSYQQNVYQPENDLEEPVSFGDWMVTTLIMCIPCVGLIMMFVWAFGSSTKKSKSNYFKAMLVWALISIVLSIVMLVIFGASFAALANSGMYY